MDREGDTGLRRQRSTDTRTQGEERTTNQTANSLRSPEGSLNSSITILFIQQSYREICLFLYQIYLREKKIRSICEEREGGGKQQAEKHAHAE